MSACCPSPVCVHPWVSTQPGPPSGVQVSSRPVSSPSSVRLSGSLVRTRLSGRLVSSPSGVQPSVVCPSGRSRLVPRPPGGGDGGDLGTAGSGHDWIQSSSMWSGPVPGGSVDGPRSMDAGTAAESCAGRRGSVGRGPGPGGASAGGCTRPTGQARPPRGVPVAGDCARAGEWLARCCRTAPCGAAIWAWSHDYSAWSLRNLTSEWTGPEGQTSSAARTARGPSAAQPGSERDRLDAGNAVTCKNGGGRDRV
jgi:hypothetical protein